MRVRMMQWRMRVSGCDGCGWRVGWSCAVAGGGDRKEDERQM